MFIFGHGQFFCFMVVAKINVCVCCGMYLWICVRVCVEKHMQMGDFDVACGETLSIMTGIIAHSCELIHNLTIGTFGLTGSLSKTAVRSHNLVVPFHEQ